VSGSGTPPVNRRCWGELVRPRVWWESTVQSGVWFQDARIKRVVTRRGVETGEVDFADLFQKNQLGGSRLGPPRLVWSRGRSRGSMIGDRIPKTVKKQGETCTRQTSGDNEKSEDRDVEREKKGNKGGERVSKNNN